MYWIDDLRGQVDHLLEENAKLRNERDALQYRLEDVVTDVREDMWNLRRKLDEKLGDIIEVLDDIQT
jgi:regulator of replication initiation timing